MNEEMKNEAIEMITTACEKYAQNYELAAKTIKEAMDKKCVGVFVGLFMQTNAGINFRCRFGTFWHACVGEGFGFEVSYETKNILYLFFGGNTAIILWKCS